MITFKQPDEILNQFKKHKNPYDFSNDKIVVSFNDAIKAMVEYAAQFNPEQPPTPIQP